MHTILIEMQYLGPVSYYAVLAGNKAVVIEQEENFVKSTYRNRCEILGATGPMRLSIPLENGRDHHQPYKEVKISCNEDWQRHHWMSIQSAYSNSPYFEYYQDYFQALYSQKQTYLFDWNKRLMETMLNLLKLETAVTYGDAYNKVPADGVLDMRSRILPNTEKDQSALLVAVQPYYQVFADRHGFYANPSIIDLLFNEGPSAKSLLVSFYKGLAD